MQPDWSKYIGIPYLESGRTLSGCDCYGLLINILSVEWGVPRHLTLIETTTIEMGTVLLFRIFGNPIHCGMVVEVANGEPTWIIHTLKGHDSVLERYSTKWSNRLLGTFTHIV